MSHKIKHLYEFGDFRLDAKTPSLWREGELIQIFPKSLEILVLLVGRRGAVVSREELLENIWQDAFVEESNITYNVSLLRKILGENDKKHFIQTVPKHGYRFIGDVREVAENDAEAEMPAAARDLFAPIEEPETPRDPQQYEQTPPPTQQTPVYRRFIGIILLGLILAAGFIVRWSADDQQQKGFSGVSATQRNIRAVAVLPLKTLTGNENGRALSAGLSDSLISRLGSLNHFVVRPPNSSLERDYMEEGDENPLEFGERLKVDAVLEGTVQMTENRLRVNVRLWDVRDGTQLWQDSFDETESDFFNLQDAISTKITQSLVSHLIEKDRSL